MSDLQAQIFHHHLIQDSAPHIARLLPQHQAQWELLIYHLPLSSTLQNHHHLLELVSLY